MKIYGHSQSTCTRKVLTTAIETQTPYELITVEFATGEHKQAEHLARQPFGQVPTIDDDGFKLYESRAIARYIADKQRSPLLGQNPKERALIEQWISIETSNFSAHVMKFIFHYAWKRTQTAEVLDNATKQLDTALKVMDARLAEAPYLGGNVFSLADICFMPYIEYAAATPIKDTIFAHKGVAAWWTRVSERPSWHKVAGRV
ncbi:MAG: hypothetical protein RL701_6924 [Pseudomonadota bacterium]|jgi:glutathione S-transferase